MDHQNLPNALASDSDRLEQLFGESDLLPLWIAEPYVPLSPKIRSAIEARANTGWYGYETRPQHVIESFWEWMDRRHGWANTGLTTSISPSVGTSIGVVIDQFTEPGDGVILQPPVFTDFKPLVGAAERRVIRNPLVLTDDGYQMDTAELAELAAEPSTRMMILCNPHNPVGRLWAASELRSVAEICSANDVIVLADEIHADLALGSRSFTPFAVAAAGSGVSWAATHGPIKTFGLAGVCDTLLITDSDAITMAFRSMSNRLHLTRNNVFALAAFETAYREGEGWLDGLLELVAGNAAALDEGLANGLSLVEPDATYLAWLDLRELGLEVPELVQWITAAGLALSPGHWFGREGAGFARMTIAASPADINEAVDRLNRAKHPTGVGSPRTGRPNKGR